MQIALNSYVTSRSHRLQNDFLCVQSAPDVDELGDLGGHTELVKTSRSRTELRFLCSAGLRFDGVLSNSSKGRPLNKAGASGTILT